MVHIKHILAGAEPAGSQRKYGKNSGKLEFLVQKRVQMLSINVVWWQYVCLTSRLSLPCVFCSVFLLLLAVFRVGKPQDPKIQYGCQFERNFDKILQSCPCWWFPLHPPRACSWRPRQGYWVLHRVAFNSSNSRHHPRVLRHSLHGVQNLRKNFKNFNFWRLSPKLRVGFWPPGSQGPLISLPVLGLAC